MHTVDVREELASKFARRATQLGARVINASRAHLVDAVRMLSMDHDGESIGVTEDLGLLVPEIVELARPAGDWPDTVIGRARFGIADTGTVVISETVARDRLMALLCVHHIALLASDGLVSTLADATRPLRSLQSSTGHSYVTFVTGPSRTSDIERVLTIGVHGPSRLSIVLLDDWNAAND